MLDWVSACCRAASVQCDHRGHYVLADQQTGIKPHNQSQPRAALLCSLASVKELKRLAKTIGERHVRCIAACLSSIGASCMQHMKCHPTAWPQCELEPVLLVTFVIAATLIISKSINAGYSHALYTVSSWLQQGCEQTAAVRMSEMTRENRRCSHARLLTSPSLTFSKPSLHKRNAPRAIIVRS